MSSVTEFPFERGTPSTIGALRQFEYLLLDARQREPALSGRLRCNNGFPWLKTRNEELVPLRLFADHHALPDDDRFILMPEGHAVDIQIVGDEGLRPMQVTTAYPSWAEAGGSQPAGYLHSLRMEKLRLLSSAERKLAKNMVLSSRNPTRAALGDDIEACRSTVTAAIRRKQTHNGSGVTLLIYAPGYRFLLIDVDAAAIVTDAVSRAGATSFSHICIVDEGFCWERGVD